MIGLELFLIIFFSLVLIKATDLLLINLKKLALATGLSQFALTSFLVALGTSLPELLVGITSALEGEPNLSLGNVLGSNIADMSLVIGGAAIVGGGLAVQGIFLRQDVFYAFLAGAAPMLLLFDKNLSRLDGLVLLAVYVFYNFWVFKAGFRKTEKTSSGQEKTVRQVIKKLGQIRIRKEIAWVFLAIALLLASADIIVRLAGRLAVALNVPILLIGLFLVAIGTSLPELVFELEAAREHKSTMIFGDLLGSVVANSTLIIGLTALISPIRIGAFDDYLLATMAFVLIFGAFYLFIRTKKKLERWEGIALICLYSIFLLIETLHP